METPIMGLGFRVRVGGESGVFGSQGLELRVWSKELELAEPLLSTRATMAKSSDRHAKIKLRARVCATYRYRPNIGG